MRSLLLSLGVLSVTAGLVVGTVTADLGNAASKPPQDAGFAVLELFTSEGCSSCPPADRLLAEIARANPDRPVYPLSFHVDYWNHLGWQDPFSDVAFSRRQHRHARALNGGRVYTPELVVNGRDETIGSRATEVQTMLEGALRTPARPAPSISLSVRSDHKNSVIVSHAVARAPADAQLSLLVVQERAESRVTDGENAAHTLVHSNVVRSMVRADASARTTLALPAGLTAGQISVVALLEAPGSQVILAAARAKPLGGL